ncbi:MAG: ABC transporter substrate-binding protein [Alphaproteobacteria bacterium]|nr:ABC transporter substrate-binding protein [Alphaproteobacteria bacterium]
MWRLAHLLPLALALLAAPALAGDRPERIVSLNLCADQMLLLLVEHPRIAALSSLSRDADLAPLAGEAAGLPMVAADAEAVLRLSPDLVLTGAFTARASVQLLRRLGVPLHEVGIVGGFGDGTAEIRRLAKRLGVEARAERLIAAMQRRLAEVSRPPDSGSPRTVIYQANGIAIGEGQLSSDVLTQAGLANIAPSLGLPQGGYLPLESLIRARPEILILEVYRPELPSLAQALLRHPALDAYARAARQIVISSADWTCPGPWAVAAVARIAAEGHTP